MTFLIPFCLSGLGLDEQIFQEDFMMKNGIRFLGTSPSAPSREQRLEFAVSNRVAIAAQTPETTAERLSKRFALATLTLPETPCYDVEAVRDSPGTAQISWKNDAEPGLY